MWRYRLPQFIMKNFCDAPKLLREKEQFQTSREVALQIVGKSL